MLSKLEAFLRQQKMLSPGDTIICALSGGADSVAMTFAFYLLKEKLSITLEAAHFNHHLRGEESQRDEAFVRAFCHRYDIPLHLGEGTVIAGEKGLEAAAREARYGFFRTLSGKIATAHTADDNAETVLMHMVRGTGLKGLGGITPIRGNVIRPMLTVTRRDAEAFLDEWCLPHMEDSSNHTDAFLRNRLRRHVMPLLTAENPRLAENLSRMALNLRQDEAALQTQTDFPELPSVTELKALPKAVRVRCLERFLREKGVREPEETHISQTEALLYSDKPSAKIHLPGGVTVAREYDRLTVEAAAEAIEETILPCPGEVILPGLRVICTPAEQIVNTPGIFTLQPQGTLRLRSRKAGDQLHLSGGTKSLKKLLIDRKIPAAQRPGIPVLLDDRGILGVYAIGTDPEARAKALPAVTVRFIKT